MARTQERFQRRVATQLRSRREHFIELLRQAAAAHGSQGSTALSRSDFVQLMEGLASAMGESLQGRSSEVRTWYVETVVPGMLRGGMAAGPLLQMMQLWADGAQKELQQQLDGAPDRSEALQWMGAFFGELLEDLQRAARTSAGLPRGSAFFDSVVSASGLSPVMGPDVVRRACEMTGVEMERLGAEHLRDVLPALRKGMSIFMGNPDMERALRRLEALLPRVVEELPG